MVYTKSAFSVRVNLNICGEGEQHQGNQVICRRINLELGNCEECMILERLILIEQI